MLVNTRLLPIALIMPQHFVASSPERSLVEGAGLERLSPSIEDTVYDLTQENEEMSTVTSLIDIVQLEGYVNNTIPLTFFSPVNFAWDAIIPTLELEDVVKNHLFEQLWFDDLLAGMDGEQITSANGKTWNIQVIEKPEPSSVQSKQMQVGPVIYFSNANGPEGLTNCTFAPGPNRTNILAKNGIIHHIDCLFLDLNYTRVDRNAPTWAPVQLPPSRAPVFEPQSTPSSSVSFLSNPKVWASVTALVAACSFV